MKDSALEIPSFGAGLATSFVSLGLVCVLAYVVLRFMANRQKESQHGAISVETRYQLDAKKMVYILRVDGRRFLVGAGDGGLTTLAELDATGKDVAFSDMGRAQGNAVVRAGKFRFADLLRKGGPDRNAAGAQHVSGEGGEP